LKITGSEAGKQAVTIGCDSGILFATVRIVVAGNKKCKAA
jgi:hypothetical protein